MPRNNYADGVQEKRLAGWQSRTRRKLQAIPKAGTKFNLGGFMLSTEC
jgi:hypothetical protein